MEPEHQEMPHHDLRPKPWAFTLIIILAITLIGVAVAVSTVPGLQKTSKNGTSTKITKRGTSAFGTLHFGYEADEKNSSAGAGAYDAAPATTGDTSLVEKPVPPGGYYGKTYQYTGPALDISGGSKEVFTFDKDGVSSEADTFARLLGLTKHEIVSGDYSLENFSLVSSDGNRRISYSPSTGMIIYSNYPNTIYTATAESAGGAPTADNKTAVSKEKALSVAADFVKEHGIATNGYGSPVTIESLSQYDTNVAVVYPLKLNGLPVYDQSGQDFGMTLYVDPTGTVTSATYLRNLSFISSQYELVKNSQTILDYLSSYYGGGRMILGIPQKEGDTTTSTVVSLKTARNAYVFQYAYGSSPAGVQKPYFLPALSFDLPEGEAESYLRRIVLPTVQVFYDSVNTGIVPANETGAPVPADIKPL
jgi:hypothetical protein